MPHFRSSLRATLGGAALLAWCALTPAAAQTASASLTSSAPTYAATGGEITLTASLAYPGLTPSALGYVVTLPAGWTLTRIGGPNSPEVRPPVPASGPLEFAYTAFPAGGASFTLTAAYPPGLTGPQTITASAIYRSPRLDLAISPVTLTGTVVVAAPVILRAPASVTVNLGQPVLLAVEASGAAPLVYQWRRGDAVVPGATNAQLQLAAATAADAGTYVAVVSNAAGSAVSPPAEVTVVEPPTAPGIVSQPSPLQVNTGQAANFRVTASGTAPLTYQWRREGNLVPGATGATYTLATATAADAGVYSVVVSNLAGQVTSAGARLTVLLPAAAGSDYFGRLPQGGAYALLSRSGRPGIFLAWGPGGVSASRLVPGALGASFTFTAPPQGVSGPSVTVEGAVAEDRTLRLRLAGAEFPAVPPRPAGALGPGPGLYVLREAGTAATAYLALAGGGDFILAGRVAGEVLAGSGRIESAGSLRGTTEAGRDISGTLSEGGQILQVRVARAGRPDLVLVGADPEQRIASERLLNLSTRSLVSAAAGGELITGFVVAGGGVKNLLVRAAGPTLGAFGVSATLAEPVLELYRGTTLVTTGRGWDRGTNASGVAAATARAGAFAFPAGSADAALLPSLAPGAYTAAIRASASTGGIALAEVYDLEPGEGAGARLVNLSARARGEGGERTFTAGFVVSGTLPKAVLIRGVGPALGSFGVADAMADPQVVLYREGVEVARNGDWGSGDDPAGVAATAAAVGAFALAPGSRDAALLVNLYSGAYTVEIAPQIGSGGQVLAEVYEVP